MTCDCDKLRAELAEARAEIAAYQGLPEGALPGWGRDRFVDWQRTLGKPEGHQYHRGMRVGRVADVAGGRGWEWVLMERGCVAAADVAETPRAAMRAAEAEARRREWLPEEVTDAR